MAEGQPGGVIYLANDNARLLRKTMTRHEVKLWLHLRTWRDRGYHFRRQVPRDGYILDFVCLRRRLIVEVDGSQHGLPHHQARDSARDLHFGQQGFKILRFWNNEIDGNLDGVLTLIEQHLEGPHPAG